MPKQSTAACDTNEGVCRADDQRARANGVPAEVSLDLLPVLDGRRMLLPAIRDIEP
jgi:hypothetical protein